MAGFRGTLGTWLGLAASITLAASLARGEDRSQPASPAPIRPSEIDALIAGDLKANQITPSPMTTDEEFIRRATLDVLGRLPEPGAIREFVASRRKDKRSILIDQLLGQPEYAENWARYWRDVVSYRSPNEVDRQVNYPLLQEWLAGEFAANKPWDQIVTAILTASGRNDEVGAVNFAMAEEGQAVELAGEVSRIFLGIQIQCAQCHDHPSDPWKREQFHEFAAFFSGVKLRRAGKPQQGLRPVFQIVTKGPARYAMPDLKDPSKTIPVSPRFFLNDAPKLDEPIPGDRRLDLVAGYVTSPENPWFTRAFINRIWSTLVGEGFYDPVDDLGPTRTASSPEVLDLLSDGWRRSGLDIKWLFRTILNTDAYQRKSRSTDTAAGRTAFASNCPSRLRADQIFDTLAHALDLGHERDQAFPGMVRARGKAAGKAARKAQVGEIPREDRLREQFNKVFGVDPSTPSDAVLGTIPQALLLMNGPMIAREIQARPATMLGQLLIAYPDNRKVLDVLYLRALGRKPSAKEVATCSRYLEGVGDRREAFEDILWALINSTEFLSRR
ncbi:DUF1549 domain-containing protein [Tundrisphaera lichenicola]|uniref:DUF1549 domain-containing protein n=1 Tax=Tundrisphaera lichenicola TaxID=2029860 RepID=UPI003EBF19A8